MYSVTLGRSWDSPPGDDRHATTIHTRDEGTSIEGVPKSSLNTVGKRTYVKSQSYELKLLADYDNVNVAVTVTLKTVAEVDALMAHLAKAKAHLIEPDTEVSDIGI